MSKVLIVASRDPSSELGGTVLFRAGVERTVVTDVDTALPIARAQLPNMVVIKDHLPQAAERVVRLLKRTAETRRASVVVLLRDGQEGSEVALRGAGASLVIVGAIDPLTWDDKLEDLFSEPRRRDSRVPVRYVVWPGSREDARDGAALNLSVRGILLEATQPLSVGATLELYFELPGGRGCEVVGQVVRRHAASDDPPCYGVDFIILRGGSRSLIEAFVEAESRR